MSMQRTAAHPLLRRLRDEAGIGLVEVLVALMIFAIIALGMGYSLVTMTRLTAESTNRETATNLAAAELDRIQSLPDPTSVTSGSTTLPAIDGVVYTVNRSVGWVPASGAAGRCGTGGGNLQYKRLNITVTWPGMYISNPVRADSALAPSTRINDPEFGTIIVSVKGSKDAAGSSGVSVAVTPDSGGGGTAIATAISPTDSDGCTFVLKVDPGKYTVTLSRLNYVSSDNQIAGTFKAAQEVPAGGTIALNFEYDEAAVFTPKYAANSTRSPAVASNMPIYFVGDATKREASPVTSEKLWPKTNGYVAVAGEFATCAAVDPGAWSANATKTDGVRPATVNPAAGQTAAIPVPMGVVEVTIPNTDSYITAVQQVTTASDGNPGCGVQSTLTFSNKYTKNTKVPIALPYGNWLLYTGTSVGAKTTAVSTGVTVLDGVVGVVTGATGGLLTGLLGGGAVTGTAIVLDPRAAI